jgi:hypothetical protein
LEDYRHKGFRIRSIHSIHTDHNSHLAIMATGSAFSDTLQSITTTKLSELSKKRATFEARHTEAISSLQAQSDPLARLTILLASVKHCFNIDTKTNATARRNRPNSEERQPEEDLVRLERFLEQAKFDPSLTDRMLHKWEETLIHHLDVQLRRYEYATLYGQLVTEWLSPDKRQNAISTATAPSADVEIGDGFEELPGKKRLEAREQFESAVFAAADVDESAIKQYLEDLFSNEETSGDQNTHKALTALRESAQAFETQLAAPGQFNRSIVERSIKGLLTGNQFTGEKLIVLKNLQNNGIILSEIADVLNMRMSTLSAWSWGSSGVPIEQRRKLNGRFDIFMHEDLLQAIFLQFIGAEWSVFFKEVFGRFRRGAWKSNFKQISRIEKKRREYYLGPQGTVKTLARLRRRTYRKSYFVYQLLEWQGQEIEFKDGEEEAEFEAEEECEESDGGQGKFLRQPSDSSDSDSHAVRLSAPRPGLGLGGAKKKRHRKICVAQANDEESDGDAEDRATKEPTERKQDLLHLLATEAAVHKRVHGSFAAFRSTFDELQNSLPHQAVILLMEFFGISKTWVDFFRAYLEAPLRFLDDEETDAEPRRRKRGAPASHTLSDVFSETMMFCIDFSVNRCTNGTFLYRLADDFWFWSHDHAKAATAWREIQRFAGTMGLPLSDAKSGSIFVDQDETGVQTSDRALPSGRIRWGMLYFDPDALRFKIDQKIVDEHIDELKRQLAAKESVFDWIQVWNAYANTFFASNFGKAANCFGRAHVDEILSTHQRIQKAVFDGKDVAQHVKSMIERRFGMKDLADGFLFFPAELGGLDLKSPFVLPLQIRDNVAETPTTVLDKLEDNEQQEYHKRKADFDKGNDPEDRDGLDDPDWKPSEGADEFMSFEEYIKYREEFTTSNTKNFLLMAYQELLQAPSEHEIGSSPSVWHALQRLQIHDSGGIAKHWALNTAYWKWTVQLYGPEMIERFGGLRVIEHGLLPIGMVSLLRDQKVKWQG